jgi:hypothetical protein
LRQLRISCSGERYVATGGKDSFAGVTKGARVVLVGGRSRGVRLLLAVSFSPTYDPSLFDEARGYVIKGAKDILFDVDRVESLRSAERKLIFSGGTVADIGVGSACLFFRLHPTFINFIN